MKGFHHNSRILELVLSNLSNWCLMGRAHQTAICQRVGAQVVVALKEHFNDQVMVKMALRCLGNLSIVNENAVWLTAHGAVEARYGGKYA